VSALDPRDLWDEERERRYQDQIELQLYRLHVWLLAYAAVEVLDERLVRAFHRQVFGMVSRFAGVVRGRDCPYDVAFGPHRGVLWQQCEGRFAEFCREFEGYIETLDRIDRAGLRDQALEVACAHHAEFIKIHPFLDGNGRMGRLCANYFAARYGLSFVKVSGRTENSDYELALTVYIREGRRLPLVEYWRPIMLPDPPGWQGV
jgi:fido (protein-threonine AMPylation protein)